MTRLCLCVFAAATLACAAAPIHSQTTSPANMATPQEKHLRDVRQLTFGGSNAEAYFSSDGKKLIFQSSHGDVKCDQIFIMNIDGSDQHMVSTGKGRTTCSYFLPQRKEDSLCLHAPRQPRMPPKPDYSKGYVWAVYSGYDIFTANPDGSGLKQLTNTPGYDAEATISLDGKKIIFTSVRNGDLDIYSMDADGKNVKQLTHEFGYDGGPTFSPDRQDGSSTAPTIRRPNRKCPTTKNCCKESDPAHVTGNLDHEGRRHRQAADHQPGRGQLWPGVHGRRKAHYFFLELRSRQPTPPAAMGNFELWMINPDGSGLERITYSDGFDGFPMFSPDGKKLVWASNRNAKAPHETNIFIADWVP